MFRAFQNRNYQIYWAGNVISQLGNWVQMVARPWLVYEITGSTAALGIIAFLQAIPLIFFSLFGGVVADRVRRSRFIQLTQTLFMLNAFALAFLVWSGRVEVWHVAVLSLINGIITSFDLPTRQTMVMDIVGKDNLMNAIAMNSAAFNTARIVGPAIAGILVNAVGLAACFFINGVTFLFLIWALSFLRIDQVPPEPDRNVWSSMGQGLSYLVSQPRLLMLMSVVTFAALFALPYSTLMPAFAKEVYGRDASGLGILYTASGVGALAAALLMARRGNETGWPVVTLSAIGLGVALIAFSFATSFPLAIVILVLIGLTATTQNATTNTLVQVIVPDELRGRVMSGYTMVFQGFMPFGNLLAGFLAEYLGSPMAVRIGGAVMLAYSIFALAHLRTIWPDPKLYETVSEEQAVREPVKQNA